jgi:hypothetical protein
MRFAANRFADTVIPLLPTSNVSVTNVMIIAAPPLPGCSAPFPTDGSWQLIAEE